MDAAGMRPTVLALALVLTLPLASAATEVKALGGFFSPDSIEVIVDEEVVWTNEDSMPHTVTSTWDAGASFDAVLRGGESFSWRFDAPGAYPVHCRPHSYRNESGGMEGMVMAVDVAAVGSSAAIHQVPASGAAIALLTLIAMAFVMRR